ncbi:VOC family protein [Weissella diestrammenae]|uniref:VOC family protein n=1 Tax=Weissella diestrammenae TaxID=1162633 RepID=A0A7G9T4J5_9LACO|nr:VOC family protein [Weissella diestrammenae]MCM0582046.1 VOC family protein [Weissella diestrammenae]QNN75020.1 VOC family protein [Weissella diestrammenae]
MAFQYIHHVAINASDYDATIDFYVDKLGFEIIREHIRKDRQDIKLDLRFGEQELEIFIQSNLPKRLSYPEALGLRHLAFRVDSVPETVALLNAKGILTEPVRLDDYTNKRMTFFTDPDGLPLEIHE